jgi:hypothetical protein
LGQINPIKTFSERDTLLSESLTKSEGTEMKRKPIAMASAAMIGLTTVAIPNKVEAHSNGWWIPGAIIGGLALGALAARPYYYGPGYYGYAYAPGLYYYYGDSGGP